MKIRRRCKCGCEEITNRGKKYIWGHTWHGKKLSEEIRLKMSLAHQKRSKETRLKMSLAQIKQDPNNPYCDIWKDKEYISDLRKDYCENIDCENNYKQLDNHHIYLDKKRCAPNDIMTLCKSCHIALHNRLRKGGKLTNPKDYIIINRPGHVSYIHKKLRNINITERSSNEKQKEIIIFKKKRQTSSKQEIAKSC